jgi:16S rRNA (cytidine1402-2'-O)-methyltransferase
VENRLVSGEERGTLFIVSTPIGNMGDFSLRAVEVLRSVAVVLAEDTRHSRPLLDRYEITTPVTAYHEHNEARTTPGIVERLQSGESIALISDAGTPLLSDPGARLVRAAADAGVAVAAVPGASALLSALVVSGLPADRFSFFGFLPRKGAERRALLAEVAALQHTAVLYEAPGRVAATLGELSQLDPGAGTRETVVARELTKKFEEIRRGTLEALAAYYEGAPPRGEVVLVIAGTTPAELSEDSLRSVAHRLRGEGRSGREIVEHLTTEFGAPRNLAYRLAHKENE